MTARGVAIGVLLASLAVASGATAQPAAQLAFGGLRLGGWIELGGNYHAVTEDQGDWAGVYLRSAVDVGTRDTWAGEVLFEEEFHDEGTFFSLGNTHTWTPDWYTSLSAGTSAGGFFFPRFRIDGFLSRKWLETRQLVTTIGGGYYDAKDVHHGASAFIGATYYFEAPWIVEGGIRFNVSDPGSVFSMSQFVALTYGRNKERYVTLRFGFGREAYQIVGPSEVIQDFASQVTTLTWRQWLTGEWGFKALAEYYHNPYYERFGVEFGIFRDF